MGKARPGLLILGAGASTQADPLSFLDKFSSGQQEAALCGAFFLMTAALQVAFPVQAASTMRFIIKVQRWIHEQRGAGASPASSGASRPEQMLPCGGRPPLISASV